MEKTKLRYAILKEIDNKNLPLTESDFGVTEEAFDDAISFLVREKYLIGIFYASNRPFVERIGPMLTEKGEKYLEENSAFSKVYKGLKEIRDWLK